MSLMDIFRGCERKAEKAAKAIIDNRGTHALVTEMRAAGHAIAEKAKLAQSAAVTAAQKHGLAEIRTAVSGLTKALSAHAPALTVTAAHEAAFAEACQVAAAAAADAKAPFKAPSVDPAPAPAPKPAPKPASKSKK